MSNKEREKTVAAIKWFVAANPGARAALGTRGGFTPPQISKTLTGVTRLPHEKTLGRMAQALCGSVDSLLAQYDAAAPARSTVAMDTNSMFRELSKVIDFLLEGVGVAAPALKERLKPVVSAARAALKAEAVALFLLPHDSPNVLELAASERDRSNPDVQRELTLRIHDATGAGLTGAIAQEWKAGEPTIRNLRFADLKNNQYVAEDYHDHLVGGQGYSTMFIPLKDRHARLIGLLAVANKKGPEGRAGAEFEFTREDEQMGEMLAGKIVRVLELSACLEQFHRRLWELREGADIAAVRRQLVWSIAKLMRAERGELALLDSVRQTLVFKEIVSYNSAAAPTGTVPRKDVEVPRNHPAHKAWFHGQDKSIHGVSPTGKSSLAIALSCNGRKLGTLSMEADGFTDEDDEIFNVLGKWASMILQTGDSETEMTSLLQTALQPGQDLDTTLRNILKAMHSIYGLCHGAIFVACGRGDELECAALYDREPIAAMLRKRLKPEDKEQSIIMAHFLDAGSGTCYSPNLIEEQRPPAEVELNHFHFGGAFLAIPLPWGSKRVGMLVAWNAEPAQPGEQNSLKKGHRARLQGLAALAGWCIGTGQSTAKKTIKQRRTAISTRKKVMP